METGLFKWFVLWTVSGLQAIQNSAACIVTQERQRDHDSMSRALIGLHWLPVDKRIEYKLLLYITHMDSPNALFLDCKQFKTLLHAL